MCYINGTQGFHVKHYSTFYQQCIVLNVCLKNERVNDGAGQLFFEEFNGYFVFVIDKDDIVVIENVEKNLCIFE